MQKHCLFLKEEYKIPDGRMLTSVSPIFRINKNWLEARGLSPNHCQWFLDMAAEAGRRDEIYVCCLPWGACVSIPSRLLEEPIY